MIFKHSTVTGSELVALDRLLQEIGDDSTQTWLSIHNAVNVSGQDIARLTLEMIKDQCLHIIEGSSLIDLRWEAVDEPFELFYPRNIAFG